MQIVLLLLQMASLLATSLVALWLRRQVQIVRGYLSDVKSMGHETYRVCLQIRHEVEDMQSVPVDVEPFVPFLSYEEKAKLDEMMRLTLMGGK